MQLFDKFEQELDLDRRPTETYPVEIINLVNWGMSTKSVIHFVFLVELSAWKISNKINFKKKLKAVLLKSEKSVVSFCMLLYFFSSPFLLCNLIPSSFKVLSCLD